MAVEADWPDAYRVNRYVRGAGDDADGVDALAGFRRFPAWMWRNADVLDFVGWLRAHNDELPRRGAEVGFYGLDLYSLHASMEAVLAYLDKVDPAAAARARHRYACFDHPARTRRPTASPRELGLDQSCEDEVIAQLVDLRRRAAEYARRDGRMRRGRLLLRRAERPAGRERRAVLPRDVPRRVSSWNLRDRHMAETLDALVGFLSTARAAREGRGLGAQLPPRRRAGDGDGRQRRVERRPARARAVRPTTPFWSASPPTTAR